MLLENYADAFEGNGGGQRRLPVYTIDLRMVELAKADAPQWIIMCWTAHLNEPANLPMHNSIKERRLPVHLRLLLRSPPR